MVHRVQSKLRGPGLTMLIPIADRLQKVNMQIITTAIAQLGYVPNRAARSLVTRRSDSIAASMGPRRSRSCLRSSNFPRVMREELLQGEQ